MDAKLKTLPEERQATIIDFMRTHKEAETLSWLREDGVSTSGGALSAFWSWYHLQLRLQKNEQTVSQVLQDLKSNNSSLSPEELEKAGQRFFEALAIAEEDSLTWKRVQDSKLKLGVLELSRQKFQRDTVKLFIQWYQDEEAKKIASSNVSTEEKTNRLGQRLFGDLWK